MSNNQPNIISSESKGSTDVWGKLLFILFWVGILLLMLSINLYDAVFMPFYMVWLLLLVPAMVMTFFMYKHAESQKVQGVVKALLLLFANFMAFGGIALYAVLAINYYGRKPATTRVNLSVIEYSYTSSRSDGPGEGLPNAYVKYKDQFKRIDLHGYRLADTALYRTVQLELEQGVLGFDIIKGTKLVK